MAAARSSHPPKSGLSPAAPDRHLFQRNYPDQGTHPLPARSDGAAWPSPKASALRLPWTQVARVVTLSAAELANLERPRPTVWPQCSGWNTLSYEVSRTLAPEPDILGGRSVHLLA